MGDTVNDLLDNLTDAMWAREDSCHGLSRPHERARAITQWHDAVSAICAALTREPLPTGTAGVVITAEMVEAAARAIQWHEYIPTIRQWDKLPGSTQDRYRGRAREALTAALAASTRTTGGDEDW